VSAVAENSLAASQIDERDKKRDKGHRLVSVAEFPVQTFQKPRWFFSRLRQRFEELLGDRHVQRCRNALPGHIAHGQANPVFVPDKEMIQITAHLFRRLQDGMDGIAGIPGSGRGGQHAHLNFAGNAQFTVDAVLLRFIETLPMKILEDEKKQGNAGAVDQQHGQQHRLQDLPDFIRETQHERRNHKDMEQRDSRHDGGDFPDPDRTALFAQIKKTADQSGQKGGDAARFGGQPPEGIPVRAADQPGHAARDRTRQEPRDCGPQIAKVGQPAENIDGAERPEDRHQPENQTQDDTMGQRQAPVQQIAEGRNAGHDIGNHHQHSEALDQLHQCPVDQTVHACPFS